MSYLRVIHLVPAQLFSVQVHLYTLKIDTLKDIEILGYIDKRKNCRQFSVLIRPTFIGQFSQEGRRLDGRGVSLF